MKLKLGRILWGVAAALLLTAGLLTTAFAAEKVYYGEAFDVFESVGQEDVCFFAHFLRYLLGDFYWIVL